MAGAVSGTTGPDSGRAVAAPRPLGARRLRLGRQRATQLGAALHHAAHFALEIVRKLARAGLGEVHAVADAQPADLAFEVGTLHRKAAALIDEAVPHVDVGDAGLLDAGAEQVVEIEHLAGRLRPANRRQADPEHRHAGALQRRDRGVDAPRVLLGPFVGAEFVGAKTAARPSRLGPRSTGPTPGAPHRAPRERPARARRLRHQRRRRRSRSRRRRTGLQRPLAQLLAIVEADHHHDEIRLRLRDAPRG